MSTVYYVDLRAGDIALSHIDALLSALPLPVGYTAVKLHFGERGNTRSVKPPYVRRIVRSIAAKGARPFLTDSATLYNGKRANAIDHLETAQEHGFSQSTMGCPIIIADGLHGNDFVSVPIDGEIFSSVEIASAIASADTLVTINHFKGHELAGFGACLKNLAMGCAPPVGKKAMHAPLHVRTGDACSGCGSCADACAFGGITVVDGIADVNEDACIGCGGCIDACPNDNIELMGDPEELQRRMAEYARAATHNKKVMHLTFMTDISAVCDCVSYTPRLISPDIALLASTDAVAIDRAALDLFEKENGGMLRTFVNPEVILHHAEKIGLGEQRYELVKV